MMKLLFRDRLFWLNYFIAVFMFGFVHASSVLSSELANLINGNEILYSFYVVVAISLTILLVVAFDYLFLFPLNWLVNRKFGPGNVVYRFFAALILIPHLCIKNHPGEVILISVITSVSIALFSILKEAKKKKSWGFVAFVAICSTILFTIMNSAQIFFFAYLVKWTFQLKLFLFQ